jgi:hypothetical protein
LATLCQHDRLDVSQTSLAEEVLVRSGKPCGMLFEVQGPRMLKTYVNSNPESQRLLAMFLGLGRNRLNLAAMLSTGESLIESEKYRKTRHISRALGRNYRFRVLNEAAMRQRARARS